MVKSFLQIGLLFINFCLGTISLGQNSVTSVDFYGVRTLPVEQLETTLGLSKNQSLTVNSDDLENRIKAMEGIEDADVAQIQYPGNRALFIGIREAGQPVQEFRSNPVGSIKLPNELNGKYESVMELLLPAIKSGKAGEDRSAGHSFSKYQPMREIQEQLVPVADAKFSMLARVLRESSDKNSRCAAAYILAYATDKKAVARELQYACDDPESIVRNNAVRALGVLATYDQSNEVSGVDVSYQPFLKLLKSLTWTDRNKGAALIDALSVSRDPAMFKALQKDYLLELEEMARWKSSGHALFAIRILARMAGNNEETIRARAKAAKSHADRMDWVDDVMQAIL